VFTTQSIYRFASCQWEYRFMENAFVKEQKFMQRNSTSYAKNGSNIHLKSSHFLVPWHIGLLNRIKSGVSWFHVDTKLSQMKPQDNPYHLEKTGMDRLDEFLERLSKTK
jgi:hypothetical protein